MTKRNRTARRAADREQAKLRRDLERLALLEPGGSADRAIPVTSPAEVEVLAQAKPCPLCQGVMNVDEHTAETVNGVRVRVARVTCSVCQMRRALYFQLASARFNN